MARRRKGRLVAMLLALAAVLSLAACGGPNFDALKDDLKFGDEEISDVMTTYSMKIPQNKPGKLIRSPQYAWANKNQGNAVAAAGSAKVYFVANPSAQCDALNATNSQISDDDASEGSGTWTYVSSTRSCDKQRKLSWLEKTMWTMYEQQSGDTIDWLSTSRNTLVASSGTVSTLQNSVLPMYDAWDTNVNKYLNIAQGVLIVAAAISLMVLAARIVWQIGNGSAGMDGHLLGKIGWIFLGVFMGSSAASIALTFFKQAHMTKTVVNGVPTATAGRSTPALASWTPGSGASFFVSDWVRLQVDPFLIIAAVCGVVAAGFKLITTQEGRELVPLGKAFMWAMLTSVCLAGFVNLFQDTVDTWTAGVLKSASNMMRDSWQHNTLAATEFFNLDWPIALVLTIVVWFCNLISKVFAYLRAGLLPIMVGVAPVWAAMSWMETGRQAFGKVMGWLFAFLLYKPVAALVMATGSAIMVTATDGDDSQAITLMLTVSVIVLLPAMIKLIVPAVAVSVGGGGVIPSMLGGIAGMGVMAAGGALKAGAKGVAGAAGKKNAAPTARNRREPRNHPASEPAADRRERRRAPPAAEDNPRRRNPPSLTARRTRRTIPCRPAWTSSPRALAPEEPRTERNPNPRPPPRGSNSPSAVPAPTRRRRAPARPEARNRPETGPTAPTAPRPARPRSSKWPQARHTATGCAPSRAASATSASR